MGGSEPSDAIRVVNALLTQIDKLSRFPNVLVLTTSNITGTARRAPLLRNIDCATHLSIHCPLGAIDLAFVDRADIKQYIGLPSEK